MFPDSWPHTLNVAVHVVFAMVAVALGLVQLVGTKGGEPHRRVGRWFVLSLWTVVTTAALGVTLFRFRAFLTVLTMLVAYWNYSGLRAVRIRNTGPTLQDAVASIGGLIAAAVFLFYIARIQLPWEASVIYSTLGTLTTVALYDLSRFAFPRRWFRSLWLYEHIVKIVGAHGALASAFFGTLFPAWQPYSQLAPSVIWLAVQLGFVLNAALESRPNRSTPALTRKVAGSARRSAPQLRAHGNL